MFMVTSDSFQLTTMNTKFLAHPKSLIFGLVSLALTFYSTWVEPTWVDVTIHEVKNSTQVEHIRIVQLSDLHLRSVDKHEALITERLQQLKPDLIVLSGDVIDKADSIPTLALFLKTLGPAYKVAVIGNWEYWGDVDFAALHRTYKKYGVKLLVNEMVTYQIKGRTIDIVGLDDFTAGQPNSIGLAPTTDTSTSILVEHSPGWFDRSAAKLKHIKFDLCISGHTHGGQITLFGLPIWKPRGSGKFSAGFYETSDCPLYVSKGLGTSVLPMRFGARPEIAVFDL